MLRGQLYQALHSSRRLMQAQPTVKRYNSSKATLPRLPVPDLQQTLQRYLNSIEPLLLDDAKRGGSPFEQAIEKRKLWAEDFANGLGKACQERLHRTSYSLHHLCFPALTCISELDKASPHNWLDDNIWLKKAYHEWRAPLLINSNWWLSFINDNNVPAEVLSGKESRHFITHTGLSRWQVRRAALLVHRILEFKGQLER